MNDMYKKEPNQSLYTASMVLGILTFVSMVMMTVYLPFIFGGLAIIMAILSRGDKAELHKSAKIGIITGIVGMVLNVLVVGGSVYAVFHNPVLYEQFDKTVEQMYGESFEDLISDLQGTASDSI